MPDKRVPRVQVRYPIWHTRAIPRTRGAVSRVRAGISKSDSGPFATLHFHALRAFLDDTLRLSDTDTTLIALAVSGRRITLHAVVAECTLQCGDRFYYTQLNLLNNLLSTMSGRGKGGKGLGKGGANCHCKILCDNIQGQSYINMYYCCDSCTVTHVHPRYHQAC